MQAYEIQKFGLESLAIADRPEPEPGPGEILIRVKACSLNYRDWLTVQGIYNPRQRLPLVPLSDGAGDVTAVGPGVTRVKIGDRVAAIFSQKWLDGAPSRAKLASTLGGPLDGMLRQFAVLSEDGVVPVPDHLSYEEAATLPCAGVTAWNALVSQGGVKAGDTVLVQGTGGLSIFALQIARMLGARVIVISSSDQKIERARALGASDGINYKTTPDWDKRARELTGGLGVDHIVEAGGAGTFAKSLRATRVGGHISVIGNLGGNSGEINLVPILMQNLRVQGILVGSREMFEEFNRAVSLHQLKPVIDRVFPFEEAREAFTHLASGAHLGKVCIRL